jgi:hypothetical protein
MTLHCGNTAWFGDTLETTLNIQGDASGEAPTHRKVTSTNPKAENAVVSKRTTATNKAEEL